MPSLDTVISVEVITGRQYRPQLHRVALPPPLITSDVDGFCRVLLSSVLSVFSHCLVSIFVAFVVSATAIVDVADLVVLMSQQYVYYLQACYYRYTFYLNNVLFLGFVVRVVVTVVVVAIDVCRYVTQILIYTYILISGIHT